MQTHILDAAYRLMSDLLLMAVSASGCSHMSGADALKLVTSLQALARRLMIDEEQLTQALVDDVQHEFDFYVDSFKKLHDAERVEEKEERVDSPNPLKDVIYTHAAIAAHNQAQKKGTLLN